jgi:hypothetical protein
MVLQRIGTVTCPGARLDRLDVYELRLFRGGPPALYGDYTPNGEGAAGSGGFYERVIYEAARHRLKWPMVSLLPDGGGSLVVRVSGLRDSRAGERPIDLIEV